VGMEPFYEAVPPASAIAGRGSGWPLSSLRSSHSLWSSPTAERSFPLDSDEAPPFLASPKPEATERFERGA
jgi:hypothetical protein